MTAPHPRGRWLSAIAILLAGATAHAQATSVVDPATAKPLPRITGKQHENAEAAYLKGAKHLKNSEFKDAENDFAHAVVLDPTHPEYLAALATTREHQVADLLQQAAQKRVTDPAAADKLIDQARAIAPDNPRVQQHEAQRLPLSATVTPLRPEHKTQLAASIVLQPKDGRHSYHERSDLRTLSGEIASNHGLRVVLDPDLATQPYRIDVDDADYADATRVFTLVTKTMIVPLDAHTFILAADTQANRDRYGRLEEETFYLPGYTSDQLKDFVSIAQSIFDIKQVSMEPGLNAVVVRGPADSMQAVERTFADLQAGGSDVVLDMKLYEVDKSHVRNLGVVLPQSISGFSLASEAQSLVSQNSSLIAQLVASGILPSTASTLQIAEYLVFVAGLGNSALLSNAFLVIGGGITTGVLSSGNAPTLNVALTNSDARTLDDLQLRTTDRAMVNFKVGTRYPIQTSLFSDIASSTTSSLSGVTVNGVSLSSLLSQFLGTSSVGSSAVVPQIQYEDLGLVIAATPRIQRNGDVGMHIEFKVTSLTGNALNGIPILGSRQFTADMTVKDGETAMMMSDATKEETAAVSGAPGLSEVPGFQSTTNRNGSDMTNDLVLMITPHIVRHGHSNGKGPYIPLPNHSEDE